ncbi:hypothetical protein D3C71_1787250 [compost metagenome]
MFKLFKRFAEDGFELRHRRIKHSVKFITKISNQPETFDDLIMVKFSMSIILDGINQTIFNRFLINIFLTERRNTTDYQPTRSLNDL